MIKRNFGLILVFLVTLVIYFPSLFYHFVGDDYIALAKIASRAHLKPVFEFRQLFTFLSGVYFRFRPLYWLPFFLGYHLTGLPMPPAPAWQTGYFLFAYHLPSLIFHLGNVFLVYLIASFIFKSSIYRALTAFIFAVHPINAEVVCLIAAIGDVLFTFFSLLSLVLFAKFYLSERKIPSSLYYLGSCLSFILALCAKESALTLPFLIILTIIFLRKTQDVPQEKKKRFSWLTYFIIAGLYFILRKFILNEVVSVWGDLIIKFPQAFYKLVYYLRDLIFPVDLALLKQFLYRYSLLPLAIIVAIFLIGLFIYIFVFKLRKFRILVFSLLWMAIALFIQIIPFYAPEKRHVYFPLVGFSIFLVSFILLFKRKYLAIFLLCLFIILEIWTTLARNDLYRITGEVVQRGLFELKKELPEVEPDSVIYLVGLPGTLRSTYAFWTAPSDKIKFIYKNENLAVFCLSVINFTEKSIKESEVTFLDNFSFTQSLPTNLEEFIRVMGEGYSSEAVGFNTNTKFKILSRDKFRHISEVIFWLNPEFLKGRKVYFIGFKEGGLKVLRTLQIK